MLFGLAVACLLLWPVQLVWGAVTGLTQFCLSLLLIISGLSLSYRLVQVAQWVVHKFLWRVRHRMLAVFFFIGVLPISLGAMLVMWGILLLFGPLTAYMVTMQITQYTERLQATADALLWQIQGLSDTERTDFFTRISASAVSEYPGLGIQTQIAGSRKAYTAGDAPSIQLSNLSRSNPLVRKDQQVWLTALSVDETLHNRVLLSVPVTGPLLNQLLPGLGILEVSGLDWESSGLGLPTPEFELTVPSGDSGLPTPAHPLDWKIIWPIQSVVLDSNTDAVTQTTYVLQTRPSALWAKIFDNQSSGMYQLVVKLGYALSIAFLANLLVSLFIAIFLTRTLTRAVHNLYIGTQHINRGDFRYRIPHTGSDQIGDLSRSFNSMTVSLEQLIEDSRKHQQLEAELEIAREVQARLFPSSPPKIGNLEVLGVCRPARSVSGDFYDYVRLDDHSMAICFGDVSGKGISAALVMATLHSIVRAQLVQFHTNGSQPLADATAMLVSQTNRQLYEQTTPEKFSTLFFGTYNDQSEQLVYSNAGHLPPLLLRNGSISELEINGMIIGTFADATYTATSIDFQPGDTLVAFTDGVSEPENASQQEFGIARLCETITRNVNQTPTEIIENVMSEVLAWTGDTTLQDDMTMLVIRRR